MEFNSNSNLYLPLPNIFQAKKLLHDRLAGHEQLHPRSVDKPIVLYGAGNLGLMACEYLKKINISPDAIVDAKAPIDRVDLMFEGIPLLNIAKVPEEIKVKSLVAICVVSASYEEIKASLQNQGWLDIVPFYDVAENYRHIHPLSNGWFAKPFSAKDLADIELALEGYSDDISRAHLLQFLAWRRLRQEWHFEDAPVQVNSRFFIPEIKSSFGKQEVFIDIGAHHGSVSDRFIKEVDGQFKEIIAIEPDLENHSILREHFGRRDRGIKTRVTITNDFLDETPLRRKFFAGLGYASQFSEMGTEVVATKTIDSLDIEPTYMKFHLEGFELGALKGAIFTINKFRPKLSITVYHNSDGIHSLILWLLNNFKDYKYFFVLNLDISIFFFLIRQESLLKIG
jgi:FkbM family methyltransferase